MRLRGFPYLDRYQYFNLTKPGFVTILEKQSYPAYAQDCIKKHTAWIDNDLLCLGIFNKYQAFRCSLAILPHQKTNWLVFFFLAYAPLPAMDVSEQEVSK